MRRYYFFCCLAQLIIAIGGQPAWGTVLANPTVLALGAEKAHGNLISEVAVCCEQQLNVNAPSGEEKIMVAQLVDIITGVGKLIINATDNSNKEKEEAARAAEAQRQAEEKAQLEEQNRFLKAQERDEQKRQSLSNPFAISNDAPAFDRPPYDASKRQLIDIAPGGPGGGSINSNQGGMLGTPANNVQYMGPRDAAMITPPVNPVGAPVGQVAAPAGQVEAPVGQVVVPVGQVAVPVGQIAAPVGQVAVPVGQIAAPVAMPVTQVAAPGGQIAAPVTQVAAPVGQIAAPVAQEAAPTVQVGTPVGQVTAPAEQLAAPLAKVVAPVEQVAAPVEHVAAPPVDGVATPVNPVATPVGTVVAPANAVSTAVGNGAGQEPPQKIKQVDQNPAQEPAPTNNIINGNEGNEKDIANSHPVQIEKVPSTSGESLVPSKKADDSINN